MKIRFLLVVALLILALPFPSEAQIPRTISYQGVLADAQGNPKPDASYTFTFRLYDSQVGGTALWTEAKPLQTKRGLFSTVLGNQTSFGAGVQFDKPYWLSIQVGTDPELTPRIAFTSVGYSLNSERADTALYVKNAITSAKILDGTIQRVDVAGNFKAPYADTADVARTSALTGTASGDLTGTYPNPTIANDAVTSIKILDGTIQFVDMGQNGATAGQVMKWNGSAWVASNDAVGSGNSVWQLNGSNAYYNGGNVGIGTSAPGEVLDVVGDPTFGTGVARLSLGSSSLAFNRKVATGAIYSDAAHAFQFQHTESATQGSDYLALQVYNTAGAPVTLSALVVNGFGNVGIGTATPGEVLDVIGNPTFGTGVARLSLGSSSLAFNRKVATGAIYSDAAHAFQFQHTESATQGSDYLALQVYNTAGAPVTSSALAVNGFGNVGIGTATPNAPLGFPPALGKKITLYPGATGDAGFAVAGNRLQIYSDNPNADVAIGYDAAGTFNERFAVKPNGAVAVSGNAGAAGQMLQSNGGGSAATWALPTNSLYNNTYQVFGGSNVTLTSSSAKTLIPGMTKTFVVSSLNAKVLVTYTIPVYALSCALCGVSSVYFDVVLDNNTLNFHRTDVANSTKATLSATVMLTVGGGSHTIEVRATSIGPDVRIGGQLGESSIMTLQVIQE